MAIIFGIEVNIRIKMWIWKMEQVNTSHLKVFPICRGRDSFRYWEGNIYMVKIAFPGISIWFAEFHDYKGSIVYVCVYNSMFLGCSFFYFNTLLTTPSSILIYWTVLSSICIHTWVVSACDKMCVNKNNSGIIKNTGAFVFWIADKYRKSPSICSNCWQIRNNIWRNLIS